MQQSAGGPLWKDSAVFLPQPVLLLCGKLRGGLVVFLERVRDPLRKVWVQVIGHAQPGAFDLEQVVHPVVVGFAVPAGLAVDEVRVDELAPPVDRTKARSS